MVSFLRVCFQLLHLFAQDIKAKNVLWTKTFGSFVKTRHTKPPSMVAGLCVCVWGGGWFWYHGEFHFALRCPSLFKQSRWWICKKLFLIWMTSSNNTALHKSQMNISHSQCPTNKHETTSHDEDASLKLISQAARKVLLMMLAFVLPYNTKSHAIAVTASASPFVFEQTSTPNFIKVGHRSDKLCPKPAVENRNPPAFAYLLSLRQRLPIQELKYFLNNVRGSSWRRRKNTLFRPWPWSIQRCHLMLQPSYKKGVNIQTAPEYRNWWYGYTSFKEVRWLLKANSYNFVTSHTHFPDLWAGIPCVA